MDLKRVIEWLATAEGLGKAVVTFLGLPALIWATVTKVLDPLGMPRWGTVACAASITFAIALLLWRSFRRFNQASRLEQPDAFTLRPIDPASLIGRADDLAKLMKSVKQNRLVLLDGESGCGKSALVFAGLIPQLQQQPDGLLPVPIRDWGDDWARGPLSAAVDAIFHCVSAGDRVKLGWTSSPDLAADVPELANDLNDRFEAVFATLGRRPLLIADQFDDHQARHRRLFLDGEANWLTPTVVARSNPFWQVVSRGLNERRLHLLVVTRADTAAGLVCVRFLGEDQSVARTLPRVEAEYLRPLLASIAPDNAAPLVVSNPTGGWLELRERLETDLKADGAILMQQVRIALLGLRQLPLLTPQRYRIAGGLHGVETLVISRALRRARDAAGGGDAGLQIARAMLGKLILPGGPNQPPKSQRASLSTLSEVAGDPTRAETILGVLQQEDVIRPAEAVGGAGAWQLDHDYLARAVLAEARQADRWSVTLREGKARYEEAQGNWRQRWSALLPFVTLIRVCWERVRNRLRFGDAARYARICAFKPSVVVLGLALLGVATSVGYRELLVLGNAELLISQFGTQFAQEATLRVWHAPERLRQRVFYLLDPNGNSLSGMRVSMLENALVSRWPLAHAGLEAARAREAAAALRGQLQVERNPNFVGSLVYSYEALATRLNAENAKAEATILRARLEQETDSEVTSSLAEAYAAVVLRLTEAADFKAAAASLRARLEHKTQSWGNYGIVDAYATIAARLSEADAKAEATILRARLEQATDEEIVVSLAGAYAAVAIRLTDAADVKAAAGVLRMRLEHELAASSLSSAKPLTYPLSEHEYAGPYLERAYATVAARLNEADAGAEATILRARLEQARDGEITDSVASAYAAVAAHLGEADAKTEAINLRARLDHERVAEPTSGVASAYAAVAVHLTEAADVKGAAAVLRVHLEQRLATMGGLPTSMYYPPGQVSDGPTLEQAYATVATRLSQADAKAEAAILRARLEREADGATAGGLAGAYAAVAVRLAEAADVKSAAVFVRTLLDRSEPDGLGNMGVSEAYATIAARLDDADVKAEAAILRTRLTQETDDETAKRLATAYAAVAVRLIAAADVKVAAATLRLRLERELAATFASSSTKLTNPRSAQTPNGSILERAYATLAVRLQETDARAEAAILRDRLDQERDGRIAGGLAGAYAAVAVRLTDPVELKSAAALLRDRLEWESYGNIPGQFARAYSQLARVIFDRADAGGRFASTMEILTLAGHPFLVDRAPLLAVLQPAAKRDFGNDVVAAVIWAEQTFGIKPSQLRPVQL